MCRGPSVPEGLGVLVGQGSSALGRSQNKVVPYLIQGFFNEQVLLQY